MEITVWSLCSNIFLIDLGFFWVETTIYSSYRPCLCMQRQQTIGRPYHHPIIFASVDRQIPNTFLYFEISSHINCIIIFIIIIIIFISNIIPHSDPHPPIHEVAARIFQRSLATLAKPKDGATSVRESQGWWGWNRAPCDGIRKDGIFFRRYILGNPGTKMFFLKNLFILDCWKPWDPASFKC